MIASLFHWQDNNILPFGWVIELLEWGGFGADSGTTTDYKLWPSTCSNGWPQQHRWLCDFIEKKQKNSAGVIRRLVKRRFKGRLGGGGGSYKSAVPLCFPLSMNHSQAQIIHMYRTPYSQAHAVGPWLQMSTPPWYNSHQGSINFLFLLPAAVYQKVYSSISFPPPPHPLQIETGELRSRSRVGGRCRWLQVFKSWKLRIQVSHKSPLGWGSTWQRWER